MQRARRDIRATVKREHRSTAVRMEINAMAPLPSIDPGEAGAEQIRLDLSRAYPLGFHAVTLRIETSPGAGSGLPAAFMAST